jgi:hypothetical protein
MPHATPLTTAASQTIIDGSSGHSCDGSEGIADRATRRPCSDGVLRQLFSFFEMTAGKPGSQLIVKEILELLPHGKAARNKHLLGFSRDGSLVAVADLGEDYPNAHDWYVALLLVTPASR